MFSTDDTIVAIATPPGAGGIGLVRLSGPCAHVIALALMARRAPLPARRATFARLVDADEDGFAGRPLDQVVVTRFAAPRSFTGDEVVEISAHGSQPLLRRVVELARRQGARLAEPGEFTLRAYLNGRLDLIQAEAVADLVDAVTPLQARAAMDQLEGTLTGAIARIDAMLFDLAARLEASLDFPEEGFHFITRDQVVAELQRVTDALASLIREGHAGRVVREGSLVVICGRPNAGKSSLFNAVAGAPRAIVTDIAGTTRDLLTERVEIGGLAVTIVDTAGLRDAQDAIEAEGVRRARDAQQVAALTLFVVDGASPLLPEDDCALASIRGPRLIVVSKADLEPAWSAPPEWNGSTIGVSSVTGVGLDELRQRIVRELTSRDEWRDAPMISNVRHVALVDEALAAVRRATDALAHGATEEMVLAELSPARDALEAVTGRRAPDEMLRHIFSRFCIGK
ncbi:MAG: tRNA uridine-5-carboxymethylaminomethyl(34) synthesis GTPase MnmE [Acidobacteria bacterium]|nr:tRNA uridine-5-carboxymethylaminomethyl(34) synthesis GTPase MnmE [Acidobacteriota bacterium]